MALKKGMAPKHIQPKHFIHPGENHPFLTLLQEVEDPRKPSPGFKYSLISVLFMVIVSMLCGAKDWSQVVEISNALREWLSRFVDMEAGVPCESTFINILNAIQPEKLGKLLTALGDHLREKVDREIIAFDGQTLRGTASPTNGKKALHLLHAWSVQNGVCIGQVAVGEKTNEITALPELMDLLDLQNTIITADALNTQKETVAGAVRRGADYVLPVKGNQPRLLEEVQDSSRVFDEERGRQERLWQRSIEKTRARGEEEKANHLLAIGPSLPGICVTETEKGHGRIETRTYTFWSAEDVPAATEWEKLTTLGRVVRERVIGDKKSSETVYFITSIPLSDYPLIQTAIRQHWAIENALHWRLDVIFRQDDSRYRDRVGATNLALLRKICLAALSKETTCKRSIALKQIRAFGNSSYRDTLLQTMLKNSF